MITYEIASVVCGGPGPILPAPDGCYLYKKFDNTANLLTPCQCYQQIHLDALRVPGRVDIVIYTHDDVEIFDPEWLPKVLDVFSAHPDCAVVGLGGATELGREGLYKRPYRISDMARGNYASAQRDWNVHGSLLSGTSRVVVVDAFFMAVRTSFLTLVGGWPVGHLSHHCCDLFLGCEAARQKKEVWAIGIDCMHYGGKSSTSKSYRDANWLQGGGLVSDHEIPHRFLFDSYRDVLPIRTPR